MVIVMEDSVGNMDAAHQLVDFHPVRASRHGGLSESQMSVDSVDALDLYRSLLDSQCFVLSICECWGNIVRLLIGERRSSFVLVCVIVGILLSPRSMLSSSLFVSAVCVCCSHHGSIVIHRSIDGEMI
jgi:hypothetical protein